MSKKSDKIIVDLSKPAIIEVNGKKYRIKNEKAKRVDGVLHGDMLVAVPFDEKEHKNRVDFIVQKLKNTFSGEEVLRSILEDTQTDKLIKYEKLLRKGAKVKKHKGCLGLKLEAGKESSYLDIL